MESSALITITKLNRSDDGLYECIANNDGEYATTLFFTLIITTIVYLPTINQRLDHVLIPSSKTGKVGRHSF